MLTQFRIQATHEQIIEIYRTGTADQIVDLARQEKPHIQYTRNEAGTAIAARRKSGDEWEMVAAKLPEGWVVCGNLFINDVPAYSGWIEPT